MTFTNWLTANPLEHSNEPLAHEDMISVDAMHLRATGAWPGGFFASYHAYPYYPDFLRYEPAYRKAKDPYAAYLADLRKHHHGQALMITEFGVPTSLGKARLGPLGRDQGDHSEQEAADIDRDLLRDMRPGANKGLPGTDGVMPGADVALRVDGDEVRLYRAAWTDALAFQYGVRHKYLKVDRADLKQGSGVRREPQQILNAPHTLPASGEKTPVELRDLSPLRAGSEKEDSRHLVAMDGSVVELRLPWAMLGLADPSSRQFTAPQPDGTIGLAPLPASARVGIEVSTAPAARSARRHPATTGSRGSG
jgi:hypothetical protein